MIRSIRRELPAPSQFERGRRLSLTAGQLTRIFAAPDQIGQIGPAPEKNGFFAVFKKDYPHSPPVCLRARGRRRYGAQAKAVTPPTPSPQSKTLSRSIRAPRRSARFWSAATGCRGSRRFRIRVIVGGPIRRSSSLSTRPIESLLRRARHSSRIVDRAQMAGVRPYPG